MGYRRLVCKMRSWYFLQTWWAEGPVFVLHLSVTAMLSCLPEFHSHFPRTGFEATTEGKPRFKSASVLQSSSDACIDQIEIKQMAASSVTRDATRRIFQCCSPYVD